MSVALSGQGQWDSAGIEVATSPAMATPAPQHRVVSMLPAAAETLCAAGGQSLLVGRGHEDDYPPGVSSLPVVTASKIHFTSSAQVDSEVTEALRREQSGEMAEDEEGMYRINEGLIRELKPTLIITQGLCSVCAVSQPLVTRIAARITPPPQVLSLSPVTLDDIIADVVRVGVAVGLEASATKAAASLRQRVARATELAAKSASASQAAVSAAPESNPDPASHVPTTHNATIPTPQPSTKPSVLFMEWTDPIYVGGHWTPQLIAMAGGQHPLNPPSVKGAAAGPSIVRTAEEVEKSDPDWVVVCPCGLDLETSRRELKGVQAQAWWQGLRAVRHGRVALVDGHHMFNRSGPRIVDALEFLVGLLHGLPHAIPAGFPWARLEQEDQKRT